MPENTYKLTFDEIRTLNEAQKVERAKAVRVRRMRMAQQVAIAAMVGIVSILALGLALRFLVR